MKNMPGIRRWGRRLKGEQGQALVLALAIVTIGLLLGLGAAAYALSSGQQGTHDEKNRGAQQAADAGVQQYLYLQSSTDAVGYNLNGGVLGVSPLLSCVVPPLSVPLSAGSLLGYVNSAGQCVLPSQASTTCTTNCGPVWAPVDNEDYYQAEFFANNEQQGTGGDAYQVQFPEIVSLGCHTTIQPTSNTSTAGTTSCATPSRSTNYSRQLALLSPTAPLQAIEAGNDVTVNSSLGSLEQETGLTGLLSALGLGPTSTTCSNLLGGLLNVALGLLGLSATTAEKDVCALVSGGTSSVAIIGGNISAGHALYLPTVVSSVDTNMTGTSGSLLGALGGVLSNVTSLATNLNNLDPTFEYGGTATGGAVCSNAVAGTNPSSTNGSCYPKPPGGSTTNPITALPGADFVAAANGACTAGQPNTACTLERPSFAVTTPFSLTTVPSGVTTISGSAPTETGGVLTIPSGSTVQFAAGTYVFCGVNGQGTIQRPATGTAVQIFIAGNGKDGCASGTGNFIACKGITSLLGLDVTGLINPSGFQIYVAGDSSYNANSADTPVTTCPANASTSPTGQDPDTQVYIGTSTVTQSFIVYAPTSEVTLNTTAAFEGSLIGWNSDITSAAILQDLDLGNYALAPVVNAYQTAQTIQCDNSVIPLTNTPPVYNTASLGSITTANDIKGC